MMIQVLYLPRCTGEVSKAILWLHFHTRTNEWEYWRIWLFEKGLQGNIKQASENEYEIIMTGKTILQLLTSLLKVIEW